MFRVNIPTPTPKHGYRMRRRFQMRYIQMNLIPTTTKATKASFYNTKPSFTTNNIKPLKTTISSAFKNKQPLYPFIKNTFLIPRYKMLVFNFLTTSNLNSSKFINIIKLHLNQQVKKFISRNGSKLLTSKTLDNKYRLTEGDIGFS